MRFGPSIAGFFIIASVSVALVGVVDKQLRKADIHIQERLAAEAVAQGHAIIFPHGMDESVFRWDLAEAWSGAPDIAVLGSSHSQLISSDFFPGKKLYNLSVAGAQLTDDLISAQLLRTRRNLPRRWIIFVDPWLFEVSDSMSHASPRLAELAVVDEALSTAGQPGLLTKEIAAQRRDQSGWSCQLDPVLRAIDEWTRRWSDRPVIADGHSYQTPIIRADGSVQEEATRLRSVSDTAALAWHQFTEKTDRHRYGTYSAVDEKLVTVFKKWIQQLRTEGAEVTLVFEPYHPAIYSAIVAEPNNQLRFIDVEMRKLARSLGCATRGDYDPSKAGLSEKDFLDGDHLRARGLKTMLADRDWQPQP